MPSRVGRILMLWRMGVPSTGRSVGAICAPSASCRPSATSTRPYSRSRPEAAGRITTSMSSGRATSGRSRSSNFSCTLAGPLWALLTALTMLGETRSPGCALRGAIAGFAAPPATPGVSFEPQPTSITLAASAGPRLLNPPLLKYIRIAACVAGPGGDNSASARACTRANRHRLSALQERWLIDGGDLLQQIIQVALPVARLGDPGKGAREGRVAPAVRHPGGMVQHAQAAQRLDEEQFAEVEIRELPVTGKHLAPLALLLGGRTRQHHPQVLHPHPRGAVIQVHEHRTVLVPQKIPQVAVAMEADLVRARGGRKGLAHALEKCAADRGITFAQPLRQQLAREHLRAGIPAESLHTDAGPGLERAQRTDLVDACEAAAEDLPGLGRIELRRAPAHPGEGRKAEVVVAEQRFSVDDQRRGHRELGRRQL